MYNIYLIPQNTGLGEQLTHRSLGIPLPRPS